jgi:hypothetical protein
MRKTLPNIPEPPPPPPGEVRTLCHQDKDIENEVHSLTLARLSDGRYELLYKWGEYPGKTGNTFIFKGSEVSYWPYRVVRPIIRGDKTLFQTFNLF